MTERRLSIVIDPTKAEAGGRVVKRTLDEMAQKAKDAEKSVGGFGSAANDNFAKAARGAGVATKALNLLKIAALGVAAALSVGVLKDYADAWSDMQSRVGAAIKNMEAAPAMMRRMVDLANASYSPLEQTVEVYTRNVAVLRDLGYAANGAADFTEALNHALVITATRGERAASVQNALSKAMAVGKLSGDGLETVLSNGGRVAEALATQLGTTVSGLRAMATEGKITGDVIAQALTGSLEQLREEAAEMPATIGDAFTRIQNNTTALVGTLDQAWGISGRVAEQMLAFADGILTAADVILRLGNVAGAVLGPAFEAIGGSLDTVAKLAGIAVAGIAGFYAPILIGGIGTLITTLTAGLVPALGAVAGALRAVGVAMLANPVGLFIGGLALAITAAFTFRDEIKQAVGVDVVQVFRDGANFIIGAMVGAVRGAMAAWAVFPQFMATLGNQAWNAFLSGFEGSAITWTNPFTGEVMDILKLDLSAFKKDITVEASDIAGAVTAAFSSGFDTDYVGAMGDGLSKIMDFAGGASGSLEELASSADLAGVNVGGGLAPAISKAGGAASKAANELQAFIDKADQLAEAMFPGEYARKEALELQAAFQIYGNALTDLQRQAVEAEIGDLFKASELGVRRLEDQTKKSARNMADELQKTLGSILGDLFSKPIEDFDDFIDRVFSGLGQLGQANLSASMDMLFGGGDGLSKAVEKGAKAGTEAGASGGIFDGLANLFGGAGGGANGNPMMNALGSAAGGLGIGYQTQDPMMGALGGALSGIGGGPIGIVAGALGGFIGGLFGASKALKEAQEKLAKLRGEIDSFLDVGEGRGVGEMTKAFREYWDKSHEYQELAMKAGDSTLQKRLQSAVNTFFLQLDKDFRLGFEGTLEALSSGQGMAGAFVSAQQQIVGLREELKAFIADTEFMGNKLGELASLDNAAEVADNLARARRAAQDYALSVLSGALEMREMEKAVAEAEGRASALQVTLEQLGMAAGDAAAAINDHLGLAMAKLRDEFTADLTASINDLSGFGFLNEIAEAQEKYQERLRDGAALGLDGSAALRELNLSLADIVQSAGLSQAQIDMLADAFPLMAGLIETVAGQEARRTVEDAKASLRSAYEAEARTIEQTINRLDRFITSLQKFRDDLRLDQNLSPLSPQQRFLEAQNQFQTIMAGAMGGDEVALGRVEDVSRQYLEEARSYYGTSEGYFRIFEEVESLLDGVLGTSKQQLTDAQMQLSVLNQQVGALIDINASVMTVAQAVSQLAGAQAASDAALRAQLASRQTGSDAINQAYQTYLGRDAEAGGLSFWQGQLASGQSLDWIMNAIRTSQEATTRSGIPSYALGTDFHPGGLAQINEYGRGEIVNLPRGAQVIPHDVSMRMAGNDNSSAALLREVQALRQQVAGLQDELGRNTQVTAAGANATANASADTGLEVRQQTAELRRVAGKRVA